MKISRRQLRRLILESVLGDTAEEIRRLTGTKIGGSSYEKAKKDARTNNITTANNL